jgi:hypothetical protein
VSGTVARGREASWAYEVWFPIEEGDDHEGSTVWPNSPPLPGVDASVPSRA